MKKILVIGAGRSSTSLIKYLLDNSSKENWSVTVVDFDFDLANKKINNHPYGTSSKLDANNIEEKPIARIHLPQRVPDGFHGSWVPDSVVSPDE